MTREGQALERYAVDVASWRLDAIERDLRRAPDAHLEFSRAARRLDDLEAKINRETDARLSEQSEAWMAYSAALAVETYLQGARDGGRIYHAFITGELPMKEGAK